MGESLCWMGAELMDEGVHKRLLIIPHSGMGGTGEEGEEKSISSLLKATLSEQAGAGSSGKDPRCSW